MSESGPRGGRKAFRPTTFIIRLLAVLWGVEILDRVVPINLEAYGLIPRTTEGLIGIFTMPFLHGDLGHLGANTASLIVLGTLVALRGPWVFTRVSLHVMVVAGAAMWILARSANHIGASGVIFGFLGFLLSIGIFERKLGSTLLSVVVGALYGGMIWGVLPGQPGISWEGHLFGFLGGIHAARVLERRRLSQETAEA